MPAFEISRLSMNPARAVFICSAVMPGNSTRCVAARSKSFASSDQPLTSDLSLTIGDILTDPNSKSPGEQVIDGLEVENLKRFLGELSKRESDVLTMRYGLFGHEPMTLKQSGVKVGLTRERVRQLEREALNKLHEVMTEG